MNFGSNNLIKISTEKDAFERLFFMFTANGNRGKVCDDRARACLDTSAAATLTEAADAASVTRSLRSRAPKTSTCPNKATTQQRNAQKKARRRGVSPLNRSAITPAHTVAHTFLFCCSPFFFANGSNTCAWLYTSKGIKVFRKPSEFVRGLFSFPQPYICGKSTKKNDI